MITLDSVERARVNILEGGSTSKELGVLVKALPSAVRRMGLVRCLEWLEVGQKQRLGARLHGELAPLLELPPKVSEDVDYLETCPRREMFERHRRAVRVFDALATLHRVAEAS